MAITYPLAAADFWERLRFIGRPAFVPQHNRKQSMSVGGDILSSVYGRPKWSINVTLAGGWHNRNLLEEADVMHIGSRDGTILAYDLRRPFPATDPYGWKLGENVVNVKTKGSNNRSVSLEGLRAQFILTKGDKLSILYDTDKYFLCEVMETIQADNNGDTDEFEIWPYIPDNVAVSDVVTLRKPCGKFKLVASSFRPGSDAGNVASGFSFSLISVP
jgi:hypothetical protein